MKAVAVGCLARLQSDPDRSAEELLERLLTQDAERRPDDRLALESVAALETYAHYHGALTAAGIRALLAVSRGPYTPAVRARARDVIRNLSSPHSEKE